MHAFSEGFSFIPNLFLKFALINQILCPMKKILILSTLIIAIFFSCKKNDTSTTTPPDTTPVACFSVDTTQTNDTLHLFTFTSCSKNGARFEWDFGDGSSSLIANPTHRYVIKGTYNVRLTAYNSVGISNTTSQVITIGNFYYTLTKVVLTKLSGTISTPPVYIGMEYQNNVLFDVMNDSITNFNQIPLTKLFADSTVYDLKNSALWQQYREWSSQHGGIVPSYQCNSANIVSNILNVVIPYNSIDTAKFSMYFKLVHR